MNRKTYIYRLLDPRDKQVKYVGKTVNLIWREKGHRSPYGQTRCARWLKLLRNLGLYATLEIIEVVPASGDWVERERHWIAYYKDIGADLCNLSNGGEGQVGRKLSEEVRERMRKMFLGRPIPLEQRALISKSLTGKVQSSETIDKRLATIKNRRPKGWIKKTPHDHKVAARIREGKLEKFSPEWKAKISASLKDRIKGNPEELARMRSQDILGAHARWHREKAQ